MDLSYTDEQLLLRDSVQKYISDNYDISERNKLSASEEGFSRDNWRTFAELGWLALPFAEDDGGIGGTPVDTMVLMEEFGKGLVVEPYLSTVVMAGSAISSAGTDEQKVNLIPGIIGGEIIATVAYSEERSRYNHHEVRTTATKDGDFYELNGTKSVVLNAQSADWLLVSARTAGDDDSRDGITMFLVEAGTDGLNRDDYPTVDGLRASEVTLENVRVSATNVLGTVNAGAGILDSIINHAVLAVAAEAVGAMEVLYKDTIAYTKQRDQFDHPLSEFQVLKHRMTEMFMEHSLAKSLTMKATMLETQGSKESARTLHALKYLIGKSGRFVGQNAVQLHGGMGMTEELRVAHYFKRLMVIDSQFGNADHHLTEFTG